MQKVRLEKAPLEWFRGVLKARLALVERLAAGRRGLTGGDEALVLGLKAALERIDAGTFGRCAQCGGEVPERRLRLRPAATRCGTCAAAARRVAAPTPELLARG